MKNRAGVILLTLIITALCAYYLSLTFITNQVEGKAEAFSRDSLQRINYQQKQHYLDSVWNEPVFHFLGMSFSYRELKETELNLGLDLQGGMHVVLEVSPSALIQAMARNGQDPALLRALRTAERSVQQGNDFLDSFYQSYQRESKASALVNLFAHVNTRGKINPKDTDQEVLLVLQEEIDQAIERSFYILRARIDKFGTSQPNIQRLQGTNRIQIELPGVDNPARVRKLLQGIAELNFWKVVKGQDLYPVLSSLNEAYSKEKERTTSLLTDSTDQLSEAPQEEDLASLLSSDSLASSPLSERDTLDNTLEEDSLDALSSNVSPLFSLLQAQDRLLYLVKDTSKVARMLRQPEIASLIPKHITFLWGVKPLSTSNNQTELVELYAISSDRKKSEALHGDVIVDARQDFDSYGRPSISMQMNTTGAKKWKKMTRENINERIAIVMDQRVYSAPVVESEIANGSSQITGDFTLEEAKDLANILKSGALPAPTQIVEDVVIGPTLGQQAQKQGMISMAIALFIVVIFMVMYYAKGGLLANMALAFNIFFILGILTQLNAALTLPGIAGIVLTMGMSIDANVLIFERIREELKRGTSLLGSIQLGYQRAYSSIVDSNVTTFLTAVILYMLGQGPIKGFAITLMVGIICSFFTSVFLTRLVITWILSKQKNKGISFETTLARRLSKSVQFAIIANRKKAYALSALLILLGLAAFFVKGGLNLGVDFLGGRSYIVTFSDRLDPSQLKLDLAPYLENKGVEVKTYGANDVLKITTSYLINDDTDSADLRVRGQLVRGIEDSQGLVEGKEPSAEAFVISSSTKVGATIASDTKRAAMVSLALALLVIFLYIFIRFRRWQFGLGALIALFHDVLIVLSIFAIAHLFGLSFEVDQVFVAAILTLIGYSINDTVIIFDRVRENLRLHPKGSLEETFNLALNETFSRTLITSATTLFVVLVLLFFGGAVLRSFSFALVVGVLTGTYSSLFIAAASVVDLIKSEQKGSKPIPSVGSVAR